MVLTGLRLDLAEVFSANDVARATYIVPTGPSGEVRQEIPAGAAVAELTDMDLAVAPMPEVPAVAAAGRTLLTHSVGTVAFVLAAAFGLFAWLGRPEIVGPHLEVEEQTTALAELAAVAELASEAERSAAGSRASCGRVRTRTAIPTPGSPGL